MQGYKQQNRRAEHKYITTKNILKKQIKENHILFYLCNTPKLSTYAACQGPNKENLFYHNSIKYETINKAEEHGAFI